MHGSKEKTRVAVVGIGGRGTWAAIDILKSPHFELAALCDNDRSKLDFFIKRESLDTIPAYGSIGKCIAKEEFDAVIVTTPDGNHAEVVIPALEANKYVFVEKPLEITEEKCRAIVEADKKAGGKTFVGFNLRFAPMYVKIKELVDEGAIGDILTIQADEFYNGGRTYFRRWNRLRQFSGGLWITKASHDFDIMYWIAGKPPVSVNAVAKLSYYKPRKDAPLYCNDCDKKYSCYDSYYHNTPSHTRPSSTQRPDMCLYNSDKDTFDHGIATVEFGNEILATYTCNMVCGSLGRRIRVSGTKGTIEGPLDGGDKILLCLRDPSRTQKIDTGSSEGGHGGVDVFILDHFYEFTRSLREPRTRPAEAMVAVLMGLAARRSVDEKRQVKMSEYVRISPLAFR